MKSIIATFLIICALTSQSWAAKSLSLAGGGWNQSIDASDLSAGPGSDLKGSYTSSMPVHLSVTGSAGNADNWRIEVRRLDGVWNPATKLYVVRTSNGSGSGAISGGLSETEVTASGNPFFSGSGDRTDITIFMKISGISVHISPGLYGSSLIYSLVDAP